LTRHAGLRTLLSQPIRMSWPRTEARGSAGATTRGRRPSGTCCLEGGEPDAGPKRRLPRKRSTVGDAMGPVDPSVTLEVIQDEHDVRRARLIGELDLATADALMAQLADLIARGSGDVVLDVRELAFVDSTGIRALIRISSGLRDGSLVVEGPSPGVRRVLELVRAESFPNLRIDWD
jgi:anti-anti-sigma factor